MTLKECPRCRRVFPYMEGSVDFVHQCDSGNTTLDQEDILDLDNNVQWNFNGVVNRASVKARIRGQDVEDHTDRGVRKSTHRQQQHDEFVEL